jgi:enoyl-CoA hydratase/carnithine racemase
MAKSANQLRIIEETPAYWRVVFDNPPLNIMGATMFRGLQELLARMETCSDLRVVVFESANPDFYLAHFDLSDIAGSLGLMQSTDASAPTVLMDTFVRLTKSPVVSIAKIRGRARGVGSEFVLACDMRFASRENTVLAQVEVGSGVHPGGGGTERLPHLVGRGRALEIIIGSDDFDGETAERYGYVNRAVPDARLDYFVDKLARRIATFDRRPMEAAKNLVNQVSLPPAERLADSQNSFLTAVTWPETQRRFKTLFDRGLNKPGEMENGYGELLSTIAEQ